MHDVISFFFTFSSLFLMSENMLLILISCIITFDLSRRKVVVLTTSFIKKSFNFNIFLLFSKIILNIINSLNLCIFIIFLRAVKVILTFKSRINVITFSALIFCIYFIFMSFLFMLSTSFFIRFLF